MGEVEERAAGLVCPQAPRCASKRFAPVEDDLGGDGEDRVMLIVLDQGGRIVRVRAKDSPFPDPLERTLIAWEAP